MYLKQKHLTRASSEDDTTAENHYEGENNLNNFTIQNFNDTFVEQSDGEPSPHVDRVFERHSEMLRSSEERPEKGPTPFTTMYYNDPNLSGGIGGSNLISIPISGNAPGQAVPRAGNNGLVSNGVDQQARDRYATRSYYG